MPKIKKFTLFFKFTIFLEKTKIIFIEFHTIYIKKGKIMIYTFNEVIQSWGLLTQEEKDSVISQLSPEFVNAIQNALNIPKDEIDDIIINLDRHLYVDLGFPSGTRWAALNIGSENKTDIGKFFAWGETSGYTEEQIMNGEKHFYENFSDYKYYSVSSQEITKYNETDNKIILDLTDDAAHVNWGDNWEIPSVGDFNELINYTMSNYDENLSGTVYTSKINGNKLFLPDSYTASNGQINQSKHYYTKEKADGNESKKAKSIYFNDIAEFVDDFRSNGENIRPIYKSPKYLTFISLENGTKSISFDRIGTSTSLENAQIEISFDNGRNWENYTLGTQINLNQKGDKVSFRGLNTRLGLNTANYHKFYTNGFESGLTIKGDVTSLLNNNGGNCELSSYAFYNLFKDCSINTAPELPSTNLAQYCYYNMFQGCSLLTNAPKLPSKTLSLGCYYGMFDGCTSLTNAPELPATSLALNCYYYMFSRCTSLTSVPELPATSLAPSCYQGMFQVCTSLTKAPELPATSLANDCYLGMFNGCSSLIKAPELPATSLANNCYRDMFHGCKSLTSAPELPAESLTRDCYSGMFYGCRKLITAPKLPATSLALNCYNDMFNSCFSLNYIKAFFTTEPSSAYTHNWVRGVASEGTFVKNSSARWNVIGDNGIPIGWKTSYPLLSFTANEDDSVIQLNRVGTASTLSNADLQYSTDNGLTWENYSYTTSTNSSHGEAIRLSSGDTVMLKGINDTLGYNESNYHYFVMNGEISVEGDITSLLNEVGGNCELSNYAFYSLFRDCSIKTAPELPATSLADYCYYGMFQGCTSLTSAPELPATSLAHNCYQSMFQGCTSLRSAPELPATVLQRGCYNSMFYGCRSLISPPKLQARTLEAECYYYMFGECMSLQKAPELPAQDLVDGCYAGMFYLCENLEYIKALFIREPSQNATDNWVRGVKEHGTFVKNTIARWDAFGTDAIPYGWDIKYGGILTFTSEMDDSKIQLNYKNEHNPFRIIKYSIDGGRQWKDYMFRGGEGEAITLSSGSTVMLKGTINIVFLNEFSDRYHLSFRMSGIFNAKGDTTSLINEEGGDCNLYPYIFYGLFEDCQSLISAPELPSTSLAQYCYSHMFEGCTLLVSAPELPATTLANYCYENMFTKCKIEKSPDLPAYKLVSNCYRSMFEDCGQLNHIKALFIEHNRDTTYNWVKGVASEGTFVKNVNATWNLFGNNGIPNNWVVISE